MGNHRGDVGSDAERRAGNSHKALENTDQTSPLLGGADYVHLR
jgi:hypothetical protein